MRISDLAVESLKRIAARQFHDDSPTYLEGLEDGQKILAESLLDLIQEEPKTEETKQ